MHWSRSRILALCVTLVALLIVACSNSITLDTAGVQETQTMTSISSEVTPAVSSDAEPHAGTPIPDLLAATALPTEKTSPASTQSSELVTPLPTVSPTTVAADSLTPLQSDVMSIQQITRDNADRLEPVSSWERGKVTGISWVDDTTLRVESATGEWEHYIDNPATEPKKTGSPLSLNFSDESAELLNSSNESISVLEGLSMTALVRFSPDNQRIAGWEDSIVRVWDTENGTLTGELEHQSAVIGVMFSPDSSYLTVTSLPDNETDTESMLTLWDLENGERVLEWNTGSFPVTTITFAPDSSALLFVESYMGGSGFSRRYGKRIILIGLPLGSGEQARDFPSETKSFGAAAIGPDGKTIAVGIGDVVALFDGDSLDEMGLVGVHVSSVSSLAFSPSGALIASSDGTDVRIWDKEESALVATLPGYAEDVASIAFFPDGETIAAVMGYSIQFRTTTTGSIVTEWKKPQIYKPSMVYDSTGKRVLLDSYSSSVYIDTSNGEEISMPSFSRFVVSPDHRLVAAEDSSDTVHLIDFASGAILYSWAAEDSSKPGGKTFDSTGTRLAVCYSDGNVKIWDTSTGELVDGFYTSLTGEIKMSPNGTMMAIGDIGYTFFDPDSMSVIEIWNILEGEKLLHFETHPSLMGTNFDFEFLSDSILVAIDDQHLYYWDTATGSTLLTLGEESPVESYVFNPDRTLLVTGEYGRFCVRDAISGDGLACYHFPHAGWVSTITFDPRGAHLATGSRNGTIALWRIQD